MAKAAAEKLRNDDRVETAEVSRNDQGVYVEVEASSRLSAQELKGDLGEYPVYVEVGA